MGEFTTEFENKKNKELILGLVYIVYMVFLMGLAGVQNQVHFRDTGMLDYIDMEYIREQVFMVMYSLIVSIIASVFRTGIVVWGEMKFAVNRGKALGVMIAIQVFVTLLLIIRYLYLMGNVINYL